MQPPSRRPVAGPGTPGLCEGAAGPASPTGCPGSTLPLTSCRRGIAQSLSGAGPGSHGSSHKPTSLAHSPGHAPHSRGMPQRQTFLRPAQGPTHTPTPSVPCKPPQEHWQESWVSGTTPLDIFQGCPEQLRAPGEFLVRPSPLNRCNT